MINLPHQNVVGAGGIEWARSLLTIHQRSIDPDTGEKQVANHIAWITIGFSVA